MSLMFNKLNTIYQIFKNPNYKEEYLRLRQLITENTNNDKMFISKSEIEEKYKNIFPNSDIAVELNEVANILRINVNNKDDYIISQDVIHENKCDEYEFEDDFCVV